MMLEELGFASVPAIVILCYLIGLIFAKVVPTDVVNKFIPVIVGVSGLIIGVAAYFTAPEMMATDNVYYAAAIGVVSGLASTGVDQIYKQLTYKKGE